ncbi:DUF817 domain-containing protein [Candidatus Uhrbacteria bacterium]|nr:DUF817 domain-containing protein [Candidatus Uhrbacteria bacterium]
MALPPVLHEFFVFGLKQARSCIFAGSFFVLLFLSHYLPLGPLPRYDFLFLAALAIQAVLYLTKIETKDEIKTIALFHVLGLCLELYKTHPSIGSWSYPEFGYLKIGTVPLFSGFMYAAVGSYISQSWRMMDLKLTGHVRYFATTILAIVIYLNFFTNHFFPDVRTILIPLVFIVYWGVWVEFVSTEKRRRMPLAISFLLIAFFIWIAENISTYLGAWKYPNQLTTWNMVSLHKISSWYLLVIISFILVANLKHVKEKRVKVIL